MLSGMHLLLIVVDWNLGNRPDAVAAPDVGEEELLVRRLHVSGHDQFRAVAPKRHVGIYVHVQRICEAARGGT